MYISAGTSECVYTYQEQPLTNLECNPYPNDNLRLSCEVQGPAQLEFSITWYWMPLTSQQPQRLLNTGNYVLQFTRRSNGSFQSQRSRVQVRQLNDNDVGWYFCQPMLSNGSLLTPSNRLFLEMQSVYSVVNAPSCSLWAQFTTTAQSCASIASDTSSTVSTTKPNLATDGNRGSIDPTSSLPTDHSFLLTSTTVTLLPTPTVITAPDPESKPNLATDGNRGSIDPTSSLPTDHSFLLTSTTVTLLPTPTVITAPDPESLVALLAAVVVVFCVIIVTLGFSIVILICRKKPGHVKSKTAGKSVFGISP